MVCIYIVHGSKNVTLAETLYNVRYTEHYTRGLQFYTVFFNFNGIQTENDSCWQKNKFSLFAKFLKMYRFWAYAIKISKKCQYDLKIKKNFIISSLGYQKTQNVYWFQIRLNVLKIKFRQKI